MSPLIFLYRLFGLPTARNLSVIIVSNISVSALSKSSFYDSYDKKRIRGCRNRSTAVPIDVTIF
jgi:hypothetical protein